MECLFLNIDHERKPQHQRLFVMSILQGFFFYQKSDLWKHQKSNRKPESSDAPTVPPVRSGKLLFPIQNQEINKKTL